MPVRVSDYYSATEELPDIEPFSEYREPKELANSTIAFAIGGDIVLADEYNQGVQASTQTDGDGNPLSEYEEFAPPRELPAPLPQRTIDDMTDPYGSPLLDGFLETDFEPARVIAYYDADENPVYEDEVPKKRGRPRKSVSA